MSTTRIHHKPALYAYQEIEPNEDEFDDNDYDETKWSLEEYREDDDDDDDFEDYDSNDSDYLYEYDSDTEEDEQDADEYLDDEKSHRYRSSNYSPTGPGYFYPEQPYVELPTAPKPSPEASSSKLRYYVLSPICDIAMIYIKFAILAILVCGCALWYAVYFGDLNSIKTASDGIDDDDNDVDTCPA